jgi:PAS domain S-box-containing protein
LCAYPVTGFRDDHHMEPFLEMCRQHSGVVPNESSFESNTEESPLRSLAQLQLRAQMLEKELALRRSEQRFQLLVEAVRDYAIFMLDPEGHVASWNRGAERIKGYKASEIIGSHFSRFYPEEDLRWGKPHWELKIAAKEGRFEDEGWRVRKDGSRFWANVIITAVRDETGKLIGFGKVTRDFTERMQVERALQKEVVERKRAEMRLRESEKALRQLSLHLLTTQDEERRRIGRDLHDSLGQSLAVLKMKLDSLASVVGKGTENEAAGDVSQCIRLTEDSIKELRTIAYLLYPPMLEEMGLKSAIPWYLDGFSARSGIKTTLEVAPDFTRLPREAELALFRVFQESLTNVHRHSGSPTAKVRLSTEDGMGILEVRDQGKGLPPGLLEQSNQDWMGQLGVGLRGMNERMRQLGGTLELVSTEKGTTVRASVPAQLPRS